MGASNSRYSLSYAVFQIASEIEFLAFSAILQYIAVSTNTLKKDKNTHLQYNYIFESPTF